MTVHIPEWVLWLVGAPVVLVVLFFAWFGLHVFITLSRGIWR